ncbi:unnamed protein product, partial [marine sediment metagenome]
MTALIRVTGEVPIHHAKDAIREMENVIRSWGGSVYISAWKSKED